LRLGTPALTSLGFGSHELQEVADVIHDVLHHTRAGMRGDQVSQVKFETEPAAVERAKKRVAELLGRHRLYPEIDLT
jgi:glycine hydroxymethyltransferase